MLGRTQQEQESGAAGPRNQGIFLQFRQILSMTVQHISNSWPLLWGQFF